MRNLQQAQQVLIRKVTSIYFTIEMYPEITDIENESIHEHESFC